MSSDPSLEALRARDPAAIAGVVDRYTSSLLTAAWGLGISGADAEEIVQETLVTFLKAVERFEGRSTIKTFLIGILYNKALERRREYSRETSADPIDEVFDDHFGLGGLWRNLPRGPEDEAAAKELGGQIDDCLLKLNAPQRMAFYLREVEHAETEAICNILGVSITHLGVLLFRARNKLRECIQNKWQASTHSTAKK